MMRMVSHICGTYNGCLANGKPQVSQMCGTDLVVFGEVGLTGEIRPVTSGQERIAEAAKHGFKRAIVPKGNAPRTKIPGIQVQPVSRLDEAIALFD